MTQEHKFFIGILVLLMLAGGGTWYVVNTQYQKQANTASVTLPTPSTEQRSEISQADPSKSGSVYAIDQQKSVVTWRGAMVAGPMAFDGTVDIASGKIMEDKDGVLTGGMFALNMASIKDSKGTVDLDTHLKSDDFFAVDKNPLTTFVIKTITPGADAQYFTVIGDLMIRGVTHEISFPATITKKDDTMMAQAKITFDRTKWGVTYSSGSIMKELGDKAIKDDIEITLNLVAVKEK